MTTTNNETILITTHLFKNKVFFVYECEPDSKEVSTILTISKGKYKTLCYIEESDFFINGKAFQVGFLDELKKDDKLLMCPSLYDFENFVSSLNLNPEKRYFIFYKFA